MLVEAAEVELDIPIENAQLTDPENAEITQNSMIFRSAYETGANNSYTELQ